MTMYLIAPRLKSRKIEIEHGCFLPTGRRLREVVTLTKKQDTSVLTHLRSELRVKISINY